MKMLWKGALVLVMGDEIGRGEELPSYSHYLSIINQFLFLRPFWNIEILEKLYRNFTEFNLFLTKCRNIKRSHVPKGALELS
jgi:hypothetical protein